MKPLNIGILSHSYLLTQGLTQILQNRKDHDIRCHGMMADNIAKQIATKNIRLIIADPLHPATQQIVSNKCSENIYADTPIIAVSSGVLPDAISNMFDAVISLYDSPERIFHTVQSHASGFDPDYGDKKSVLTSREKEIIKGIVKGLSNKEIATEINVSVNTVMTHRRNIASKLQIHSPAGLTIYAIVSKLVSIDEIRHSIN